MLSYIGADALTPSTPTTILSFHRNSSGGFSCNAPEFTWSHQLSIITALKGKPLDYRTRCDIVESIYGLSEDGKMNLIDFLETEQGAIASTMENNACKVFNCTPDDLNTAFESGAELRTFFKLWNNFICKIIPAVSVLIYPLEEFNVDFDVNKVMFMHFRDRVVSKIFLNFQFTKTKKEFIKKLISIFSRITFETRNNINSIEFGQIFKRLIKTISAKQNENELESTHVIADDEKDMASETEYEMKAVRKSGAFLSPPTMEFSLISVDSMTMESEKSNNSLTSNLCDQLENIYSPQPFLMASLSKNKRKNAFAVPSIIVPNSYCKSELKQFSTIDDNRSILNENLENYEPSDHSQRYENTRVQSLSTSFDNALALTKNNFSSIWRGSFDNFQDYSEDVISTTTKAIMGEKSVQWDDETIVHV